MSEPQNVAALHFATNAMSRLIHSIGFPTRRVWFGVTYSARFHRGVDSVVSATAESHLGRRFRRSRAGGPLQWFAHRSGGLTKR